MNQLLQYFKAESTPAEKKKAPVPEGRFNCRNPGGAIVPPRWIVPGTRSAPRGSSAVPAGGEQQTPGGAFYEPFTGLSKGKCTLRHHGNKISRYSSTPTLMAARTGLGAEHSGAEHGGTAGTRAKLRITRRQKQIDFEPIDLPNCLPGLKPKVIVRGYNPEKPTSEDTRSFCAYSNTNRAEGEFS